MPKSSKNKHETRRTNRDRRQRLEELRKQQRAAERRKNFIFAGSAIAIAIALIAGVAIPIWLDARKADKQDDVGYLADPTSAEKAAGCDGVHNDKMAAGGEHVPNAIDYVKEPYGDTRDGVPPLPPTSGKHSAVTLGDTARFYPVADKPRPERAVHNLEHGYVVVWYDDKLPAAEVDKLEALAKDPALPRLIVVGWWQGELPTSKHVALTSWGRTDRCSSVSDEVVRSFVADRVNQPPAPEAGAGVIPGSDGLPASQLPPTGGPDPMASATTGKK